MSSLFGAEIRKLRTVRTTWVLTIIGWLLVLLSAGVFVFVEDFAGAFDGGDARIAATVDQIGSNAVIVLIVAILAITTEFRHGTIGRALQLTPSRTRVLIAKMAAGVVYALVFFVTSAVLVTILLVVAAGMKDVPLDPGGDTLRALWQGPAGLALNAVLGVAIGALMRSQVVTITIVLVWLMVAETLINALAPGFARWLPFQALNALFLSQETLDAMPEGQLVPLDPPVALLTFIGYVVVAAAAAAVLMRTRDV